MHVHGMAAPMAFQQGPRPAQNGAINPTMNAPPMGTIALNTVIDHIIHKTYHDIVVMADLLPGKSDMERKNDIAHFANRTRQLVIRLLAVVKWASSVGKVSKCEEITQLLDQQAMLFIDTADKLHTLANQLVVQARLPNFAIPASVDVLTTGTYPRLPRAIRDKILPPDPITPLEKAATLKRLNQIIMYRLVTTKIPLQIMELIVDKGMVKLVVPREFQAMLTLMGDGDEVPWRLLKLEFMVEDKEAGSGRALVHNLQINYIHELVQSRLIANEDPLQDLYNVLHSFCLSLQLEVLQAQTVRLIQERWGRLVQIDEYLPGVKVVLSYWRLTPYKSAKQESMTVAVHQRQTDDGVWILDVTHKPALNLQNLSLVENASKIRDLSFERLLSDTIKVRSFQKLYDLQQMLQKHIKNDSSKISDDQSSLIVPLIKPCQSNENLCVSIDPQTGIYVPMLVGLDQQLLDEMEKAINDSPINLLSWIPRFRNKLARERCKSSVQNLPAYCVDDLTFANKSTHPIGQLSNDIVFIKLKNFSNYYVVVELIANAEVSTKVLYQYHLLTVTGGSARQGDIGDMKADSLVRLETSLSCDAFDEFVSVEDDLGDVGSHFNSELAQVVSISNARIPFISLIHDLTKEGIMNQGLMEDGMGVGLSVKIMSFPDIPAAVLKPVLSQKLVSSLLECSFKLIDKSSKISELSGTKIWIIELVFSDRPLKTESQHGTLTRVMLNFDFSANESPVKLFNDEWTSILKLYEPVSRFSTALKDEGSALHQIVSVYSYNYRSLVLKYGKSKHQLVTIKWSIQNEKFVLLFGRCNSTGSNSHTIASHYLMNLFNSDPDIGKLVQILHDTSQPLQAVCSLSSIPLIGMTSTQPGGMQQNPKSVSQSFSVVIQSPSHIRLIYRSTYALDIHCLPDKKVAIRDGSLSLFDSSKVKEGTFPIVGLKSFISLFEVQGSRKRSMKEKDDPPAPEVQASSTNSGEMRTITRGVWAGSNPIILEQDVFTMLLSSQMTSSQYTTNILEQFLGHTLIRRELEQIIHSTSPDSPYYTPSPNLVPNPSLNEPLSTFFAANSLMFRCTMQFTSNHHPFLNLAVQQVPPLVMQERGIPLENWQPDDLLILERFFKVRVATQPFRPSNIHAFCNIISSKSLILRDFINVMRLELKQHQNDPTVKWIPQICLTVPPWLSYAPAGLPAVYIKDKILIFVLMTMKNFNPANPPINRQAFVMPIVWYLQANIGTLPAQNNQLLQRIEAHLRQYMEERRQSNTECHMFTAIKYLMDNFSLP